MTSPPDQAEPDRGWAGPAFWLAVGWLLLVVAAAVTASWLPLDPGRQDLRNGNRGPSLEHLFGTTRLGEDLLARVVHGSRVSLVVGLGATAVGLVVGATLGVVAAYARGWVDVVVMTVVDALSAFPALVLALALVIFVGQGLGTVTVVVGVLTIPLMARVVRVSTSAIVDRDYVVAARALGAGHRRIVARELVPNLAVPVGSYALVAIGIAMLAEGALSFLGVGIPVTMTSWGQLLAAGQRSLASAPHLSLFPGAALFVTVLALNFVGEQLAARWDAFGADVRRRVVRPAPGPEPPPAPTSEPPGGPVPSAPAAPPPLLDVVGLTTTVHTPAGAVTTVRDVSFTLEGGRTMALVGESGAGKTMLARSLLGLTPRGVTATLGGQVRVHGVDLRSLPAAELRGYRGRRIAMVFQDPMTALDPVMRVGDQIAELVRAHLGVSRVQARARALELLAEVGVADPRFRSRRFPHELSGGLRQRVAIAMALAGAPELLVADEATSALDVTTRAQILDLLARLQRERGMALLLISHDLGLVAARADTVAVMYAGRVVEHGPASEVFARPRMPYTAALLAARPALDGPSHRRLLAAAGQPPPAGSAGPGCAFAPRCPYAGPDCTAAVPALVGGTHRVACVRPLDGQRR